MKKKILHLIATNFFGGPEKQIIEHFKRIDRSKYDPIAASFIENNQPNEFLERASKEGIKCCAIPMTNPFDFRALLYLNRFVRANRTDLLCVHGYKSSVLGWFAAKQNRIPIVAFSRGYTAENFKIILYQWIERRFLGRMDGVIAVSKGQLEKLQRIYKIRPKRMWVVHNAISVGHRGSIAIKNAKREVVLNSLGLPAQSKIIVSAGRLSPEKGYIDLIKAISLLNEFNKNTYFVICGDGVIKPKLMNLADSLGISDKILFAGFRKDMPAIYNIMEFLVLPSLTEGLPNVVLEAFAAKKAVVATNVGGVPEIVDDGINGFLCLPGNPASIMAAIQRAFNEKICLLKMGAAGFDKVNRCFSAKVQTRLLESIYRQLFGEQIFHAN